MRSSDAKTRPWADILKAYIEFASHSSLTAKLPISGMIELVKAIQDSRYASGVQAWTSMHDLCIVQTPVYHPYSGPYLRISPIEGGKLDFRYVDTPRIEQQWHRVVDQKDGFKRFEKFLEQLHWFTIIGPQSSCSRGAPTSERHRFKIEYIRESNPVMIIVRSLGATGFSIGKNSTLGGCRLLKYLDQPRSTREDGTQDPAVFAFCLADNDDRKKLSVGAEVEFIP